MSPAISSAMACCCLRGSALTLSRIRLSRMYDSTLYLERPRSISSMTCRPQPSTKSYSSSTVKGRSCACNSRSTMPASPNSLWSPMMSSLRLNQFVRINLDATELGLQIGCIEVDAAQQLLQLIYARAPVLAVEHNGHGTVVLEHGTERL